MPDEKNSRDALVRAIIAAEPELTAGIDAARMSSGLSSEDVSMVEELVLRGRVRDWESDPKRHPPAPREDEQPETHFPLPWEGQRYQTIQELRRATQEVALKEWNEANEKVARWLRDGTQIILSKRGPVEPRDVLYLSKVGSDRVMRFSAMDKRAFELERDSTRLMREFSEWLAAAKDVVSRIQPNDRTFFATNILRTICQSANMGKRPGVQCDYTLVEKAGFFEDARAAKDNYARQMIAIHVNDLFDNSGNEPRLRDYALASILCGEFPLGEAPPSSMTPAEIIADEMRAMRLAVARAKRNQATVEPGTQG